MEMQLDSLLTDEEVISALRLDVGRKDPKSALHHLRRTKQLAFVRVGSRVVYRRKDVDAFIQAQRVGTDRH